jgi:hypothetical protein
MDMTDQTPFDYANWLTTFANELDKATRDEANCIAMTDELAKDVAQILRELSAILHIKCTKD